MIDKIRYWCHKILPLVYDDSLSYYEFLCKMNAKLNEVIDSTNGLVEAWKRFQAELEKAWQDYKSALTAEWTDYRAEMDLKYSTLLGTVNTEINAMKTDISTFKNDISSQITEFETKVNGDYAEFTAAIKAKINAFIAKYNAEIAKIPDEITTQVNNWWSNEENYNTLVENVANAIGTTLTSGAVTFATVGAMTSATASTLPAKTLAVCTNYYNTDGIYTLWVIVSGNVSDGVSRLSLSPASDRTAILLSEKNADTLGLRGCTETVSRSKLLTMCKNNYKSLKLTHDGVTLHIPSTTDVGSASITPLAIYGISRKIATTIALKNTTYNTIESISCLTVTIPFSYGASTLSSGFVLRDIELIAGQPLTLNNVEISDLYWRDAGGQLTLTPTRGGRYVRDSTFALQGHRNVILNTDTAPNRGIDIEDCKFHYTEGESLYNSWHYIEIHGNAMPIVLRNNTMTAGTANSAASQLVLANCKNFTETGKVIICEGNRNEVGGASHPHTMLSGNIPSDIVYVNNTIRYGNTYAMSTVPTTGSFSPARVIGVTSPIGYLRTSENLTAVHGTPLTLTYPEVSHWTANEGFISLSSDTSAEYKVTFRATVRLTGPESTGNAKITLSGRATDSRTFSAVTGLEYVPISFEFYWGTGGGFSIIASSETENMTLFIREAEVLIERLK